MKRWQHLPLLAVPIAIASLAPAAHAQISLQSAVNLALKNSPKVRGAQADLAKARAARGEAEDAYVPMVSTQMGYGQSTGAPLSVPVIFSISAQSLVFSFSQRDYIRATEQSVQAAEHSLHMTETDVVEDTTNTYIRLDSAIQRRSVLREETNLADQLVNVTGDRVVAGVDARVEMPKSHRTATQIRLQALQLDDEISQSREHLAQLTGLPPSALMTDRSTIPEFSQPTLVLSANSSDAAADSDGIKAAFATAKAKQYVAFGDHRYLLRPQIVLATNYSRVDAGLSSYASYYPRFGGTVDNPNSQNSLTFGLQVTIPLLDLAHRSKARESAADAARALADAETQRGVFREGRAKLQNAAAELDLRAQLARDEQEIAKDQLEALQVQLQADAAHVSAAPVTPKDQLNAQLQERQKYLDVLNAELQLRQTQVNLLRQTDGLGGWVLSNSSTRGLVPSLPGSGAGPTVPGTAPGGSTGGVMPSAPLPSGLPNR